MDARALDWAGRLVWGLVLSTAALAVAGIAAMFLTLPPGWAGTLEAICVVALAGIAAFALGVANSAAAAMRVLADERGARAAFVLAFAVAGLCGMVSLVGVHIGWAVLTDAPQALPGWQAVDAAGLGLAFVKPAMSYVIAAARQQTVRAGAVEAAAEQARLDAIAASDRAHRHAEAMRRIELAPGAAQVAAAARPAHEAARPLTPPRQRLKLVGAAVAAGALAAGGVAHAAPPVQPAPKAQPVQRAGVRSVPLGTASREAREQAQKLIQGGMSVHAAARATGVPRSTCRRDRSIVLRAAAA